ncbi:MAG: hypothetical protein V4555_21280, partial [Acidobacteriota bacterium]
MKHLTLRSSSSLCALAFASLLATGCGSMATFPATSASSPTTLLAAMQGKVHGGQGPILGAHVYLFQASQAGYGSPATSILRQDDTGQSDSLGAYVTTGAGGSFTITGDYGCTQGQVVYLLATGGNPGLSVPNPTIALMAVLGVCPSGGTFSSSLSITVDELTTVAGAYALSGFMTDVTHLSAPSTAVAAITNAAANANFLVDTSAGATRALTPNGHGTVPAAEINTLGNILAYCINSDGTSNCSSLFALAQNGSTTPTDTLTAMLNIVHNPGANVAALYNLVGTKGDPFQPTLTTAPNDWSVEVTFNSASANDLPAGQSRMAFDASGNLWIPHSPGTQEIGPDGSLLATNPLVSGSYAAISPTDGSIWVAGQGLYYNSSPVNDSGTNYSNQEVSVALDSAGNAWTGNQGPPSFGEFTGTTAVVTNAYSVGGLQQSGGGVESNGIAVDSLGDVWTLWRDHSLAAEIDSAGNAISLATGATGPSLYAPTSIAIDASDNAWILGQSNQITVFTSSAALASGSGYPTSGFLTDPQDIAFDGAEYLKLQEALGKLRNKGGHDSLVITGKAAYVMDVDRGTVVTA